MANYNDLIKAGLLNAGDRREAGLMGLIALGQSIGNRGAARLSPTPPPLDLAGPMAAYQNSMNTALQRGALAKKMRDDEKRRNLFMPQPVNEAEAQRRAQRYYRPMEQAQTALYGMSPLSGEDNDMSLEAGGIPAMAQDAVTAALPAARAATMIPDALSFMEPSKAMALMQIGQKAPKVGLQGLMSALGKNSDLLSPAAFQQQLELRSAARRAPGAQSKMGKIMADFKAGLISQEQVDGEIANLERVTKQGVDVEQYNLAVEQGYPGTFMDFLKEKAASKRAPGAPKSAIGKINFDKKRGFINEEQARFATENLKKVSADARTSLQRDYDTARDQGFAGTLLEFIAAKKKPADTLKSVPGVGVVDFADPNNPVIKMASVTSQRGRYKDIGPYYLDGQYIGEGSFDKFENKRNYINSEGERVPLPNLAQPRSEGFMGGSFLNAGPFFKLTQDLTDSEISFDQLKKYFKNIKNTRQGFGRLADIFTSHMKTLAGERKLSLEEFSTRVATGQQQGLLGKMRIEVVGGGVMTEQDAIRVIEALGGKVGALQNKEVVAAAIKRIMGEKLMNYKNMLITYNINVKNRYGAVGHREKTMLNLPANLFDVAPQTSGGWSIQEN